MPEFSSLLLRSGPEVLFPRQLAHLLITPALLLTFQKAEPFLR